MDNSEIKELKHKVDIISLIESYGIRLKRQSNSDNYMGACPFHNNHFPSFSVSKSKKVYHCFGCGESGDMINFIMVKERVGFQEAVKKLKTFI